MASGGRPLYLLLESNVEESLRLIQSLIGLWVWRVTDVFKVAGDGRHVVRHTEQAEAARSPRAGIVIVAMRVRGLLPCKVPPLALELYLGGLHVHLPSPQAICLLLKVVRMATGTQVRWHDLRRLIGRNLTIDVVAHVGRGVAVDVVRVIL